MIRHGNGDLYYGHFEWCLKTDVEKDGDYSQTFEAGQSLELMGYAGLADTTGIDLNGKFFRLPDVSFAFGDKTLILSDKAAADIKLSKKLGTTAGSKTPAKIANRRKAVCPYRTR